MMTSAPHQETERRLAVRTREAWSAYREGLRGLDGPDYEEAERRSWERLQEALRVIDAERAHGGASDAGR
jgi:hypothetical protein